MSHAAFPALQARSQETANTEGIIINISGTYKDTMIDHRDDIYPSNCCLTFFLARTQNALPHHTVTHTFYSFVATLQCPATHWQTHASAAKAAVDSLTRSLALEWGPEQIRVVGIAPGPIANTPGTTKLAPSTSTRTTSRGSQTRPTTEPHDHDATIAQGIPLGRLGTATEIGHAAVFLATSHYTTGTTLIVDGGQWLYKPPLVRPNTQKSRLFRLCSYLCCFVSPTPPGLFFFDFQRYPNIWYHNYREKSKPRVDNRHRQQCNNNSNRGCKLIRSCSGMYVWASDV